MVRQLAGITLAAALAACGTTYKATPIASASGGDSPVVDVLQGTPQRPYQTIGTVSVKKYKPGWSDPTVTDAIPEIRKAGAELGAEAVIVRSSRSNGDRHVYIEGEAIRYTGTAPASPAAAATAAALSSSQTRARGDRAERDCAALQIESIRRDCEKRMRSMTNELDCQADGPVFQISRRVDAISDAQSCTVTLASGHSYSGDGGPIVIITGSRIAFGVMGDDFPGKSEAIRVDGNAAFVFDDFLAGAPAERLLTQIRTGRNITTRYNEWPQGVNRDRTFKVCNLAQAIDDCRGR